MAVNKYVRDYEIVTQQDKNGRESQTLKYLGDLYYIEFEKGDLNFYRKTSLLVLFFSLMLHFGAGFTNNDGMRQFFVAIPYVAAYLPFFYFCTGLANLPGKHPPYRRDRVELSFKRIRSANYYLFVLLTAVVVGESIFLLFFTSDGNSRLDYQFLLLELIAATAQGMSARMHKSILINKQAEG